MSRKTGDMQKRRIEDPTSIGSVRGLCTDSATTPQNRSTTAEADLLLVFEKWTKSSSEDVTVRGVQRRGFKVKLQAVQIVVY